RLSAAQDLSDVTLQAIQNACDDLDDRPFDAPDRGVSGFAYRSSNQGNRRRAQLPRSTKIPSVRQGSARSDARCTLDRLSLVGSAWGSSPRFARFAQHGVAQRLV